MIDNFINVVASNALISEDPGALLLLLFLFLGRFLPIIALSPFLGSRVLPHPVKVAFALSLFFIFLPKLSLVTTTQLSYNVFTLTLFAKELFVGYVLGFLMSIPFSIVQAAGMYVDHQRGGASLMVNDPTIQNQSSPLGTLFNFVLIFLFFRMDGPFLFIEAIMQSYDVVPPDQYINPQVFVRNSPFWTTIIELLNTAVKIAVQLASPALIAILMTDVFLGIANRLAPQVQITFLGLPLKSLMGLTVICIGWQVLTEQMVREAYLWLNKIINTILLFRPN